MQTGITGSADRKQVWQQFAGENTNWTWVQDTVSAKNYDIFIDLDFDFHPERLAQYAKNSKTLFLLSAVNLQIENAFASQNIPYSGENVFGINAIPTFLERKTLEICNPFDLQTDKVTDAAKSLGWDNLEWVKSRVGMVTPRIVFMIINEAYYTLQEGTANAPDIDQAMKLGVNYPMGPFEWCKKAGIDNIYQTLLAIYNDTKDERYKICPALKTEWLRGRI